MYILVLVTIYKIYIYNMVIVVSIKKLRGLVSQRTIPTERPPLVGEVSANFSG
jgi:hypothetical protein